MSSVKQRTTIKSNDTDNVVNNGNGVKLSTGSGWCLPLMIYIIIVAIGIITTLFVGSTPQQTAGAFIANIIVNILIGILLWWLCKTGKVGWAWFVLLLPIIIWIILSIVAFTTFFI